MSSQSVSQRLHDELGRLIAETEPGERLPSEPTLAKQLNVSRATLREAMRTFETQGLIRRKQGSGTYVSHPGSIFETGLEVLESIETLAERIGLPVKLDDFKLAHRPADRKEAEALNLGSGTPVWVVSRSIRVEDRPVAYLIDILPEDILSADELGQNFTGSVLDFLLQRGKPELNISRTEITLDSVSSEIARSLGIQRNDIVLRFKAYLYTVDGRVVDYSFSYFLPGYFRFQVVRRVS